MILPRYTAWHVDSSPAFGWEASGVQLGLDTDAPNFVAGEPWNAWGDGRDDAFVFRNGLWFGSRNGTPNGQPVQVGSFGLPGDLAVIGDFQNSGDCVGVVGFRNGQLYFIIDSNRTLQYEATDRLQLWGIPFFPGDRVLSGFFLDFNGEDLAVFRGSNATWEFYLQSPIFGAATTHSGAVTFGAPGDIPVAGDVNGDGKPDLAVWRPLTNQLLINLWEQGAPVSGYGPGIDVDIVRDYTSEVLAVQQTLPVVDRVPWNVAAGFMNANGQASTLPPVPFPVTWNNSRILCPNSGGMIQLSAFGPAGFRYVWTRDSATGPVVGEGQTISIPAPSVTTNYHVRTENFGPCTRPSATNVIQIYVTAPTMLTEQPVDTERCPGGTAVFNVGATGDFLRHQWRRDGVPLADGTTPFGMIVSGSATPTLTLTNVRPEAADARFDCIVSNDCATQVSRLARLSIPTPITISRQPEPAGRCVGRIVDLSVETIGGSTKNYMWYRGNQMLVDGYTSQGSLITGAESPLLRISNVQVADMGIDAADLYWCRIYDACTFVESQRVAVRLCVADMNCDDSVDLADFFEFFAAWDISDPRADVDGEPGVDLGDFFAFFQAFDTECV